MRRLAPLFLIAALSLTGCDRSQAPAQPEMQLRSYQVPSGYSRDLRNALSDAFTLKRSENESEWAARVTLAPDGRLVVLAPASVQEGVASLVAQFASKPPTPPGMVEMTYWLVLGRAATEAAPRAPALTEIQPALDSVVKAQGTMSFELLERVQLSALSGERGIVEGKRAKIQCDPTIVGDAIISSLQVSPYGGNHLTTNVQLTPGQTAVLAETGYAPPHEEPNAEPATLFIIVRANPLHASNQP